MKNKNKKIGLNDQKKNAVIREGRPVQFGSVKAICSIRIPEHLKIKLKGEYGSIQRWIDGHIRKELKKIKG